MGIGIYPDFRPPLPGRRFESDGKALATNSAALDAITAAIGVPAFSSLATTARSPRSSMARPMR